MNPKWILANAMLRHVFGRDMLRPGEDQSVASIVSNNFTLAIVEDVTGRRNAIRIQMRASLVPNDASKLAVCLSQVSPLIFGPHFELNAKGELLYGDKALEYVWGKAPRTINDGLLDDSVLEKQYDRPN